jgi:hypothetical protein
MIEVLKQSAEDVSKVYDILAFGHTERALEILAKTRTSLRQAIAELESQEPVAWMHIMDNTEGIKANGAGIVSITQKRKHPFGKVGIDFSKSYPVTSTPLYTHPPQRTWQGLTDEEIASVGYNNHPLDGIRSYAKAIEAKLKQNNGFSEEKNT